MEGILPIYAKNDKTHHFQVGFLGFRDGRWLALALIPAVIKKALFRRVSWHS